MATFEKTEYVFPDPKEEAEESATALLKNDDIEIEIVDNTPPADRNREPLDEPPEEVTDEELERYTDVKLKERLAKLGKGYHDERRAKEAATREKEEAIRLAQAVVEENKKLKGSLSTNQEALLEQAKRVVATDLEKAKTKYKAAYESGDSDAMVDAQEELTAARQKVDRVNSFKPTPLQEDESTVQIERIAQTPPVDRKAEAWKENNPWFGKDREMTGYAFALHEKLVIEDKVDPNSDEYYRRLNGRIRQVFPEKFNSGNPADAQTSQRSSKSNVVAPASRSVAPRKITLSPDQVRMANRLNVPLKLYAEKVAEQERNKNG